MLRKTLFWDYDIRALDRLPAVVRAQRYVDLWPVVDQALLSGQADLADLRTILDDVRSAGTAIRYPERVRELVIRALLERPP